MPTLDHSISIDQIDADWSEDGPLEMDRQISGDSPPDGGIFDGSLPAREALEKVRNRLLDLSARNRLLNYRHPRGKSAQIVDVDFNGVFNRLMDGKECIFRWVPEPTPLEYQGPRPDARTWAAQHFEIKVNVELREPNSRLPTNSNSARALWVLHYPQELTRLLYNISRDARLAIEETGTNMLYLVFGFLEFYDARHSERPLLAPLVAVPILLSKKGEAEGYDTYEVTYTGDDLRENLTLREKLKKDFDLNLPQFDDDVHLEDVDAYLEALREVVHGKENWKVKRQMSVAMLSFGKLALWAELDSEKWPGLLDHKIIKALFQGNTGGYSDESEDRVVDDFNSFDQIIYEADSSQHNAIANVLDGKTMVINGPPGTGKSQTITNIIASALVANKSVLFVAEKSAALEVVKNRLEGAGLGEFCLELHSHKTQKKKLLENIESRMKEEYKNPPDILSKRNALVQKRQILREYAEILNSKLANELGYTVFDILWAADHQRGLLREGAEDLEKIVFPFAVRTRPDEMEVLRTTVQALALHYPKIGSFDDKHPWFGFFPTSYPAGLGLDIQATFDAQSRLLSTLRDEVRQVCEQYRLSSKSFEHCDIWVEVEKKLKLIGAPPNTPRALVRSLFSSYSDADASKVLDEFEKRIGRVQALQFVFSNTLLSAKGEAAGGLPQARECLVMLDRLNISNIPIRVIKTSLSVLTSDVAILKDGLAGLSEISQVAGVSWEASDRNIQQLKDCIDIAVQAPTDLLGHRGEAFEKASIDFLVSKAKRQSSELRALRAHLLTKFYLDQDLDPQQLQSAVQTLRSNTGTFRWINREWRRARRLFLSLSTDSKNVSMVEAASELAQLNKLVVGENTFRENQEYVGGFGTLFSGLSTDWGSIERLVSWYRSSQETLAISPFPFLDLNLTTFPEAKLSLLKAQSPRFFEKLNTLRSTQEAISRRIEPILITSTKQGAVIKDWSIFVDDLDRVAATLTQITKVFEGIGREECSAAEIVKALEALSAYRPALDLVNSHADARRLLGPHFAGMNSDLTTIARAFKWGKAVRDSDLPQELESQILMNEESTLGYSKLASEVVRIAESWRIARNFSTTVQKFGPFNDAQWMREDQDHPDTAIARLKLAQDNLDGLLAWSQYNNYREIALNHKLDPLVELLEKQKTSATHLGNGFEFCFFNSIALDLYRSRRELSYFSATSHEQTRSQFVQLDREIVRSTGRDFAFRIDRATVVPEGEAGYLAADYTEKHLLLREINKQRKHIPIRQLMKRAGKAIRAYKPCYMMSPLSVAHYLEPTAEPFDLVVMDEASQIRPEDAIGAIARGKQVVVVGDPKQLPPSNFFDRMADSGDDESEETIVEPSRGTESVLDVFKQLFETKSLRWHYRSRHQSLIAFSNHHFYDRELVVFPTPYLNNADLGLQLHYVSDGNYAGRQNIPEAMRVVSAAVNHMIQNPERSLGIVTLAITQRDLIELLFQKQVQTFPKVKEYLDRWSKKEGHAEPFFIKNLENVQGDERDVIYISTTFGPQDGTGPVRQNFGPISKQGGWRRLNVLFTRAKHGVHLFTSMRPADIVVDSRTPQGTKALRDYIEYASSGVLEGAKPTDREPDSDFELSVANVLREHDFEVTPQLGVAGYFIDIAVRNDGNEGEYLAAIECDGASYHSGASVRDRDRIRQEIIEGLGWKGKIYRIWSTDWYRNRAAQIKKLVEFLENRRREEEAKKRMAKEETTLPNPSAELIAPVPSDASLSPQMDLAIHQIEIASDEIPYVELGDTVTYILTAHPSEKKVIRLVEGPSSPSEGKLNVRAPVAVALLGLEISGEEELIIDGKRRGLIRVLKIEKPLG